MKSKFINSQRKVNTEEERNNMTIMLRNPIRDQTKKINRRPKVLKILQLENQYKNKLLLRPLRIIKKIKRLKNNLHLKVSLQIKIF